MRRPNVNIRRLAAHRRGEPFSGPRIWDRKNGLRFFFVDDSAHASEQRLRAKGNARLELCVPGKDGEERPVWFDLPRETRPERLQRLAVPRPAQVRPC